MLESGATGVLEQQQQVTEQQEAKEQEVIILRFQGWIAAGTAGPLDEIGADDESFRRVRRTVRTPERAVVSHP
jgi:hypothetical protein